MYEVYEINEKSKNSIFKEENYKILNILFKEKLENYATKYEDLYRIIMLTYS